MPTSSSPPPRDSASARTRILIAFACVYFFWGSTYLAMRFGVEVLPPFVLASIRFLIAGSIMLALCGLRGLRIRQSRRDLTLLAAIGILMIGLGNMGIVWCEQYLSSGLSALIIAVVPLYVAVSEVLLPHGEGLRTKGWIGIAIGFLGLLILLSPGLRDSLHGNTDQLLGGIIALASAFAWSCGSVLARRTKLNVGPFVAAGWQMIFGGLFDLLLLLLLGNRGSHVAHAHFGLQAWSSILYLVTFGSLVGYTAYIYLLEHVPVAKVSTYAYINPIVAVVLGAIFLHERMVPIEYAGMAAIVIAVYLVTSSKLQAKAP